MAKIGTIKTNAFSFVIYIYLRHFFAEYLNYSAFRVFTFQCLPNDTLAIFESRDNAFDFSHFGVQLVVFLILIWKQANLLYLFCNTDHSFSTSPYKKSTQKLYLWTLKSYKIVITKHNLEPSYQLWFQISIKMLYISCKCLFKADMNS